MDATGQSRAHPLTQAHADKLVEIINTVCPNVECDLAKMREAGLPNEIKENELRTLKDLAYKILRVYFPERLV